MKKLLISVLVLLGLLSVLAGLLGYSTAGLRWILGQASSNQMRIEHAGLRGSLLGGIAADRLTFNASGVAVTASSLELKADIGLFPMQVTIERLRARRLDVTLPAAAQPDGGGAPFTVPRAPVPLTIRSVEVGTLTMGEQAPIERIALAASWAGQTVTVQRLQWAAPGQLSAAGTLSGDQLAHELNVQWNRSDAVWALDARGTAERSDATLSGPDQLQVSAVMQHLNTSPQAQGTLSIARSDLAATLSFELHAQRALLTGELTSGANTVHVDALRVTRNDARVAVEELRARLPQQGLTIDLSGPIGLDPVHVELAGAWTVAPPGTGLTATGQIMIDGAPEAYALTIDGTANDATARLLARGNTAGFSDLELLVEHALGTLRAAGEAAWQDHPRLRLTGQVMLTDPSPLWTDASGSIAATYALTGALVDGALDAELDLRELAGTLNGHRLSGAGAIRVADAEFKDAALRVAAGDNTLELSAPDFDRAPLSVSINAPRLGDLIGHGDGRATATITIADPSSWAGIDGVVNVADGEFIDWRVENAALEFQNLTWRPDNGALPIVPEQADEPARLSLQATAINGPQTIDEVLIEFEGDAQQANITTRIAAATGDIDAAGVWSREQIARVEQLAVDHTVAGRWSLSAPVVVDVASVQLRGDEPACLSQEQSRLCLETTAPERIRITAEGVALPLLQQLAQPDAADWRITGALDADLDIGLAQADTPTISGIVAGGPVTLVAIDQPGQVLRLEQWRIELDGRESRTAVDAEFRAAAAVASLSGQVNAWPPDENSPLALRADVDVPDLTSAIGLAANPRIRGQLMATVNISGSPARPRLLGEIRAEQLQAPIERYGGQLTDGQLLVRFAPDGAVELVGAGKLGGGRIEISGDGQTPGPNRPGLATVHIKAADAELANSPDLKVRADLDLMLKATETRVDLNGAVGLKATEVRVGPITESTPTSDDIVFVDADAPEKPPFDLPVFANIAIRTIDPVAVSGPGLDVELAGDLVLTDEPLQPSSGLGELQLKGSYAAFGQPLTVSGRAAYARSPLANPDLNVLAVRETNDRTVGVRITGTANAPEVELFSEPPMDQADILSYLILGKPLESSTNGRTDALSAAVLGLRASGRNLQTSLAGVRFGLDVQDELGGAALSLGRYLAPDLYLSYSVGLVEQMHQLALRYQLGRHWSLQTQVSQEVQASVKYRIER